MNKKGTLFIISGPSGAGKGTLVKKLLSELENENIHLSVSYATRSPREGEINGVHYNFVTEDQFKKMVEQDEFLEYNNYCHGYYGTLASAVIESLNKGRSAILEIDYNGMQQTLKKYPDIVKIFISPPSIEILEKRLRDRGTESEEKIKARIRTAEKEMEKINEYDYVVINDHLETATKELVNIFKSIMTGFER